jgi:iron complex outermembrane receptor protein
VTAGGAMLKLHLDGNYDSGFYANYTDANYDNVTARCVTAGQG